MKNKKFINLKLSGVILFLLLGLIVVITQDYTEKLEDKDLFAEKAGGYSEFFKTITVPIGETISGYLPGYRLANLTKLKEQKSYLKSSFSDTLVWQSRGPYNIGGRTRSILVDPDDPSNSTWYAGTAGGGIWKTEDAGESWIDLTPDLPNLSTVVLCMAETNHDIILAGTGEGFGGVGMITGDGIFKSTDRGNTWNVIESTRNKDFYYINDIWVSPESEDILLVATNAGIFRSTDGGQAWDTVYKSGNRVQDIVQNPKDIETFYAAVNSLGVFKSTDGGRTWQESGTNFLEIAPGVKDVLRLALSVSPVDTSYVYASAETYDGQMQVYISMDAGQSWLPNERDDNFINFHNAQGWYNNTICSDPYIAEKVYVAGVYVGSITFDKTAGDSEPTVLNADTLNTSSFLDFINFGGAYLGGGMSTGFEEEAYVTEDDFVSVEIRFGPGISQKAHRFQVPEGEGPGVDSLSYTYYDYVDVPFQVWDMTNNQQLMVSFRDQERDGAFNLIERTEDPIPGREYIFVNSVAYDSINPNPKIAKEAGHYYKMIYFFWPTLAEGGLWDPNALPESMIKIDYGSYAIQHASTQVISSQSKNTNLHVDHHQLLIIPGSSANDDHTIISANDGGVAVSYNSGESWRQLNKGFYTTQFYGVAKKPGEEVYIGGMQDNGTWRSPQDEVATDQLAYNNMFGGDGFEVLWHPRNKNSIIGSVYNNQFLSTTNGGATWASSVNGLGETGPFISKLSHSRSRPDTVYTIDAEGVYRHTKFGSPFFDWELTEISDGFAFYGQASSSIDVEVSKADPAIIWAGQGIFTDPVLNIFISEDYGESFVPVTPYNEVELGFITAIETHPVDPNTAYLLFSYEGSPKIVRTEDKGNSWEDITGFGTDSVSNNGFPDVVVLSLLVMPQDPDVIWAGTEIGIVESVDNGISWHMLDSEFPNVAVFKMLYQDNQIILATHGRGIWTASNKLVDVEEKTISDFGIEIYPNPVHSNISIQLTNGIIGNLNVKLMSVTGQVVKYENIPVRAKDQLIQMDIGKQEAGNYFLQIVNENQIITKRIVVY